MSCGESESLIKSWSRWDLARLAPEQANYLDCFSEEPRNKRLTAIRRCCLTILLACLLPCLLAWSEKKGMGRPSGLVL